MNNAVTLKTNKSKGISYWVARWVDRATGKERGKNLGRVDTMSERNARKAAQLLELDFDANPANRARTDQITLKEYVEAFASGKRAEGKDAKTVKEYELVGRLLCAAIDPARPIGQVTYVDAQRFAVQLRNGELEAAKGVRKGPKGNKFVGRKTGSSTASKYISKARSIFRSARIQQPAEVRINPFEGVKSGKVGAKPWHHVSMDEFELLFKGTPENWKYLFALARLAALSYADAVALKWSNVDMTKRVIKYAREKTGVMGEPPIVPRLHEILTELKSAQGMKIGTANEYVLPRPLPSNIGRDWKRVKVEGKKHTRDGIAAAAGVVAWSDPFHTSRKSAISDWANNGVPAHVVKGWAAHSSIVTTLTYYVNTQSGHFDAAIKGTLGKAAG